MPRKPRIHSDEVWYHVMNRGAAKQPIFLTNSHRLRFIELLSESHDRFDLALHAYCLMGNHYHLMFHTPRANIGQVMHYVDGAYTQYFNRSRDRDGPLFRGRYRSVEVTHAGHWAELTRYIHLNPVEGGFVRQPEEYRWSSYRFYIGIDRTPSWLQTDYVLNTLFGDGSPEAYRRFTMREDENALSVPLVPDPERPFGG